jgi:hypothetical protein
VPVSVEARSQASALRGDEVVDRFDSGVEHRSAFARNEIYSADPELSFV